MTRTNSKRQRQIEQLRQTAEDARQHLTALESQIDKLDESDSSNPGSNADAETEQLALNAMTGRDVAQAQEQGLSRAEYLREEYGVDVSTASDKREARARVMEARDDNSQGGD